MTPGSLVVGLAIVVAQTILLFLLSRRLLLGYALQTLASRSPGRRGRRLISLLRLPGNLLHELSHAAAYLVSGYTIRSFATCAADPDGRGYVETGPPWSPIRWAPLSAALSCAAPILLGALAISALGSALGVPLPASDVVAEGVRPVAAYTLSDLQRFLTDLNWSAWQTYLFWYLAFSIGAELAPSPSDLRQGCLTLCALLLLLALSIHAVPHMELRPERATAIYEAIDWLLSTLSTALFAGLIGCGLVGLPTGLLAWAVRRSGKRATLPSRGRSRRPSPRSRQQSDRRG